MKSFKIGDIDIKVPIVQGGMGVGISLSGLASAVANEGGVGVISCAGLGLIHSNLSKDYIKASILGLKEELRMAREKTKGVIGVNIMVVLSNFKDMVKTSIAEKADIIFAGAGLPLDLPSFLTKDSKTKLVPIISSVRAFKILVEKWHANYGYLPDAVVVEGPKAGGHLGYKPNQIDNPNFSLEQVVPEVVAYAEFCKKEYNKEIPVIVAGGIYNGADIYDMEALGADAVQLGSKFVTTEECDASIDFKKTYINASQKDISIIASPVGMPGRAIEGEFTRLVAEGKKKPAGCPFHCIRSCDYTKSPYCIMLALYNASRGNLSKGYAFAGANAYLANKITSVKETMNSLIQEYKNKLNNI